MEAVSGTLPCQSCCWPGIPLSSSRGRRCAGGLSGAAGHVVAHVPVARPLFWQAVTTLQHGAACSTALLREGRGEEEETRREG